MQKQDDPALPSCVQEQLNIVWYERDKSELPDPPLFWRAIWPYDEQSRSNLLLLVVKRLVNDLE